MRVFRKNILVLGMGQSGIASAKKLKDLGANVWLCEKVQSGEMEQKAESLKKKGINVIFGEHHYDYLDGKDLLVVSPGVPKNISFLEEARMRGISVLSEIELAYRLLKKPKPTIVGITGTNGKTTTTHLVNHILKRACRKVVKAGNVGFPMIKAIDFVDKDTILVLELSSFQLDHTYKFHPHVAVVLNITQDHLDWHSNFNDYVEAKKKIYRNQRKKDFAIYNWDDLVAREISQGLKSQSVPFSKFKMLENGLFLEGGWIISTFSGREEKVLKINEVRIIGDHNLENIMAAVAIALIFKVPLAEITQAVKEFKGLPHRVEYVATINGVNYYNDSKATNPDATYKALTAFNSPIILLAGGRNKGNSFKGLAQALKDKVKIALLFGEAAPQMKREFAPLGIKILETSSLEEAVKLTKKVAEEGDVVLLSPACASFDMFQNYEERGDVFKEAVYGLRRSS